MGSATQVTRKLAAILSADAVGYSRLMAADELGTVQTLTAHRESIARLVEEHRGRIVDAPGDNLLVEFPSALDAVSCALAIQRDLQEQNGPLPEERRMLFRIGIHLGDVLIEGERIYGDGVNISARLEALAEAGGVCISGTVCDQVRNKLSVPIEDLGEQALKNIPHPIRAYRLRPEAPRETDGRGPITDVGGPAGDGTRTAAEKPSIAVLAFSNMSGDPEQEYFADGITEDIITGLSKISGLFVIARNSSFAYKGKSTSVKEIGRELGVRHLLEGSVRKAGVSVRITAQLVEAASGHHLWAERYDRKLEDVFAVQDEVTEQIISALKVRLTEGELARREQPPTGNMDAYDLYLRAYSFVGQVTPESNRQAREVLERAIALDGNYAAAYSLLALTYLLDWALGRSRDPQTLQRAHQIATKAVSLDDTLSIPHTTLGTVLTFMRSHDEGILEGRKAVRLGPNYALAHRQLGLSLALAGRPAEAIPFLETALRLDPHDPLCLFAMGEALYFMGRLDEAIACLRRAVAGNPSFTVSRVYLAAAYSEHGDVGKAREEIQEVCRIDPGFNLGVVQNFPIKEAMTRERFLDALGRAGLS